MELIQAIILGLVQGLTEFIPVSSSGHLLIFGEWLHFRHSGLAFDTVLDIGTLLALGTYFWRDFWAMAHDLVRGGDKRLLASYIIIATIPGVIAGVLVQELAETTFRSTTLVAINLIWVGLVMLMADRWATRRRKLSDMTLSPAIAIGFAQALALVPGVSRSGATITAGRALGFDRVAATRFSFLLSAPIITGATLKVIASGHTIQDITASPVEYGAAILAAFISGWLAIKFLISYLSRHGLTVFAVYRVVLGVIVLVVGLNQ